MSKLLQGDGGWQYLARPLPEWLLWAQGSKFRCAGSQVGGVRRAEGSGQAAGDAESHQELRDVNSKGPLGWPFFLNFLH